MVCLAPFGSPHSRVVHQLLLITLVLRFAVPLVTVGSNELFQQFLANDYKQSQAVLESGAANVRNMAALDPKPQTQESQGLLDRWKEMVPNVDVKERLAHVKESAEQSAEKMINLMVVFLLQTLIFPLLLLWGLASFAKSLLVPLPAKIVGIALSGCRLAEPLAPIQPADVRDITIAIVTSVPDVESFPCVAATT